jgi:hypothetical protein
MMVDVGWRIWSFVKNVCLLRSFKSVPVIF